MQKAEEKAGLEGPKGPDPDEDGDPDMEPPKEMDMDDNDGETLRPLPCLTLNAAALCHRAFPDNMTSGPSSPRLQQGMCHLP